MKTKINLWHCAMLLLFLTSANAQQASENLPVAENENFQRIHDLKLELIQANQAVSQQKLQITNLETQSANALKEIATLKNAKETVSIYGFDAGKSIYETALSALLGLLFVSSLVFVFKFRSANFIKLKATEALANLEEEFEEHVRNSLEREQKLRRLLQDELNRHRISQAS
jgi:hypothetical protein